MSGTRGPVDVSVITSGHDVADARLHREVAALVAHGLRVEVLGLGEAADGPPGAAVRTWGRQGSIRRAQLAARMAGRAHGSVLLTLDPDSALAANTVVLASGRVLAVDVHEDFARLLQDRPWASSAFGLAGYAARGLVAAFTSVARRAALTIVADDHVPPLRARNRLVLPNRPVPAMLPGPTELDEQPRALYVGDVRESRGLFAMLQALRLAPAWRLDIVGPVAPADQSRLEQALAKPDLAARVTLHGRRPPTQSWELARGAWCGMLLLADTPAFREAMPSKLFEYLACGLPVITTDLPRQGAAIGESGAGVIVSGSSDPAEVGASVAEHLNAWAGERALLQRLRDAAKAKGAALTADADRPYDAFAQAVAALL